MTVSIKISVNGNYKVPFSFKQGNREENHVISGRGMDRPNEHHVNFYHGPDVMTLSVGPEERDDGEGDSQQ